MAYKQSTTRKTVASKITTKRTAKSTVTRTKSTVARAKSTVPRAKSTVARAKSTVTQVKKSKVTLPAKALTKRKTTKTTVTRAKKSKVVAVGKITTKIKTVKTTVSRKPYPKNRRSKKDFKWDQLPTVPFEKICSFLWNSAGCDDLASLRQVNRRVKAGVDSFMALSSNRPRLESLVLEMKRGSIHVQFNIYPMNIPFYDMTHIDRKVYRTSDVRDGVKVRTLRIIVRNNTEPIIDQVRVLLPTTYRAVFVYNLRIEGYSIISALLGSAKIDKLYFVRLKQLDDAVSENIVSVATQTSTKWCIVKTEKSTLTNPDAFVNGLDSQLSEGLRLRETRGTATYLFGKATHFWEKVLNEKMSGGSKVWCDKTSLAKAPVDISGLELNVVEWKK